MGGLLIESPLHLPKHTLVNFSMTAEGEMHRLLEFTGSGEVVRVEPDLSGKGYIIAIESASPIEYYRVDTQERYRTVKAG